MRLQIGLLHLDGRPASTDDWAGILGEFAGRTADIAGEIADGPLVMAYRGDRITTEEEVEIQPFRLGPYVLTWDGRLDNREELADRVGLQHLETVPDPAIVLKAYDILGNRVFADLVGEFALALWCNKTRSLEFARSACGARTLYYVIRRQTLIWSSYFAHLVRVTGVDLAVNDNYLLEYLVSQPASNTTPLAKVDVIPPNCHVQFKDGRLRHSRELWSPTGVSALRYRTDGEYEEQFRTIVKEAVQVRLRAKRPVFAELSGGLDSSTIALMADHILRGQDQFPSDLQTVSCVYEQSKTCDEQPFIQAVAEKRGVDTHFVHERDQEITLGLQNPQFSGLPNALHCFPGRYRTTASLMQPYGARVLLTGRGGDHLFWSEVDGTTLVADEIRNGNILRAHSECLTWSQVASAPYYELLLDKAIPLALESIFPCKSRYQRPIIPEWFHPKHKEQVHSITPGFAGYTTWRGSPSKRAQVLFLEHMFRYLGSGFLHEYDELYFSHPYSHRPLVEFCLGTPVSQFLRRGQTRSLMRRAFQDLLPRKTARRVSKGLLDEGFTRALQREWASVLAVVHWQICEREFVEHTRLMEALNHARLGILDMTGSLLRLFSLERWLRSLSYVQTEKTSERAVPSWTSSFLRFERS
jgi:asparagine synthase (glutamine-hydrolysing)